MSWAYPIRAGFARLPSQAQLLFPGLVTATLVGVTAQCLSEHYGAPAMLMALLLGLALNFLSEDGSRTAPGIAFTVRTVLRLGVALLGARMSVAMLGALGAPLIALTVAGVGATILCGLLLARLMGRHWQFGFLTGGAVAICGASAAMAISAILPRHQKSERDLVFTVLSVTVLSTVAMVIYPMIVRSLGFSALEAGVFIGGTIHDVAQVVGAGFSVSPETGETATLVKLLRVSMLAPVVLIASLVIRADRSASDSARPPLLPGFVIGFVVLAGLNSLGVIPQALAELASNLSRWALLVSVAAVGIKTSLARILDVGTLAIFLLVLETLFIGIFILSGLYLLG